MDYLVTKLEIVVMIIFLIAHFSSAAGYQFCKIKMDNAYGLTSSHKWEKFTYLFISLGLTSLMFFLLTIVIFLSNFFYNLIMS